MGLKHVKKKKNKRIRANERTEREHKKEKSQKELKGKRSRVFLKHQQELSLFLLSELERERNAQIERLKRDE